MRLRDLTYALRSLRQSPTFVATAVLTLGLALGLTTTMFGILDAVVHPYVPFRDPDGLYWVWQQLRRIPGGPTTADGFALLREGTRSFAAVAGTSGRMSTIQGPNGTSSGSVQLATDNIFEVLGVRPYLGRLFRPGGDPEDARSAVVSYEIWRRMFAGRRSLEGAVVSLDDRTAPVIGVLPPGVNYAFGSAVWLTAGERFGGSELGRITAVVRLQPGVTAEAARAELAGLAGRLNRERGPGIGFWYHLRPVRFDPERLRDFHFAMAGAALVVLLIACANLANLMLVRVAAKRREIALRMALGATRGAVARQVLAESALVAAGGGALGLLVAAWTMGIAVKRMPQELSFVGLLQPHLSWRVYVFVLLTAAATVVLFGLVPALRASDIDVSEPLKGGAAATTERSRRYSFIVMGEVALAMTLLMGAGLLARAAQRVGDFDFRYDPRPLLKATALRPRPDVERDDDAIRIHDEILERARRIPGVRAAATIAAESPEGNAVTSELAEGGGHEAVMGTYRVVSPGVLRVFGITIVAGRDFAEGDRSSRDGVVILDEAAARRLWPGSDPVGRMIKLGHSRAFRPWLPVVGVAKSAWLAFPNDPYARHEGTIYVVRADGPRFPHVVVRATADMGATSMALSRIVLASWPRSRSVIVESWLADYEASLVARRFMAALFALLGVIALVLSSVGLYGVLAYAVSRRSREFGVRLALGARPRDVVRMVAHDGAVMVLAGIGVGAFAAMAGGTLLSSWIWDLHAADVVSLVAAELLLAIVAVAVCVFPALRAARADPAETVRAS
ncbi:MAG: ADOP family duplicated permease [Gemmatimonadaceae bacterium]